MTTRKASTLTDSEITQAFDAAAEGCTKNCTLGHPDKVRIAYAWLSVQDVTARVPKFGHGGLNDIIRAWGGIHINRRHVAAAARLLGLKGAYPYYNIKHKSVFPNFELLDGIPNAFTDLGFIKNLSARGINGSKAYRTNFDGFNSNKGLDHKEAIIEHLIKVVGRIESNKAAN